MRDITKISTILPNSIKRRLFVNHVLSTCEKSFSESHQREEFKNFAETIWDLRFQHITFNILDFYTDFGKFKFYMLVDLSIKASSFLDIPLGDIAKLGSWENKFKIKDMFNEDDDNQSIRDKWANDFVLVWNVLGSITKWRKRIFDEAELSGATILDYGCSVGILSYLAKSYGIAHTVISDVPGVVLDFAEYQLGDLCTKVPVTSDSPPPEITEFQYDVAYAHHVLEHVPEPYEVVEAIHKSLKPGGTFYVTFANLPMTVGGINLVKAQEEREAVLQYLRSNFEVIKWWETETEYILKKNPI